MSSWALLLATFALLASTTAAQTESNTTIFVHDGPAFIFTSSQGTVLTPVVSAKGSTKKGVAITADGQDIYTFTPPVIKVIMQWVGGINNMRLARAV